MKNEDIKKLDGMFQKRVLKIHNGRSVFGGQADMVHHFFSRRHKSIRWYIPNGIPLTLEQHLQIHNKQAGSFEDLLISMWGQGWYSDLLKKRRLLAQDIDIKKVEQHLNLNINYYL